MPYSHVGLVKSNINLERYSKTNFQTNSPKTGQHYFGIIVQTHTKCSLDYLSELLKILGWLDEGWRWQSLDEGGRLARNKIINIHNVDKTHQWLNENNRREALCTKQQQALLLLT